MVRSDQLLEERSLEHRAKVRISQFLEKREKPLDITLPGKGPR